VGIVDPAGCRFVWISSLCTCDNERVVYVFRCIPCKMLGRETTGYWMQGMSAHVLKEFVFRDIVDRGSFCYGSSIHLQM
jgi:hypothetical protein